MTSNTGFDNFRRDERTSNNMGNMRFQPTSGVRESDKGAGNTGN